MKNILILCNSNPDTDPRPHRMIHYLKDKYQVTIVGQKEVSIDGVISIGLFDSSGINSEPKRLFAETQEQMLRKPFGRIIVLFARTLARWLTRLIYFAIVLMKRLRRFVLLSLKRYEDIVWLELGKAKMVQKRLATEDYDLIISHDITLMPLVFQIVANKKTRVMLDAREFYPRNFDDQPQWRRNVKPVNEYLCQRYLPMCDKVITVSKGLAQEYERIYRVRPEVFMSLPTFMDLSPTSVQSDRIRIIHHGYASYSRRTEVMIEMMDFVDERFELDLMLLETGDSYYKKIVSMARKRKNVRVIPPVPMNEIIPYINQYDIGLFLCPPTNFNLRHTLPNKFFEFIQARLAVAIGPGIEMKEIVEKYNCGIISKDFTPMSLATELNLLTPEKIMNLKNNSNLAARELNAEANRKRIHAIIEELIN